MPKHAGSTHHHKRHHSELNYKVRQTWFSTVCFVTIEEHLEEYELKISVDEHVLISSMVCSLKEGGLTSLESIFASSLALQIRLTIHLSASSGDMLSLSANMLEIRTEENKIFISTEKE